MSAVCVFYLFMPVFTMLQSVLHFCSTPLPRLNIYPAMKSFIRGGNQGSERRCGGILADGTRENVYCGSFFFLFYPAEQISDSVGANVLSCGTQRGGAEIRSPSQSCHAARKVWKVSGVPQTCSNHVPFLPPSNTWKPFKGHENKELDFSCREQSEPLSICS